MRVMNKLEVLQLVLELLLNFGFLSMKFKIDGFNSLIILSQFWPYFEI